jgi:phage/plasmid-like protein (TIGR03299 family)
MPALFESGFFVREPAWHGLGTVLAEAPKTWEEFRTAAGLDWEPVTAPLFGETGIDEDGRVVYAKEEGIQKIVRSDNPKLRLATVGETYHLINHADMGKIAGALLEDREVEFETGGSLEEGRRVWALFRLGEAIQIKGDPSAMLPFVALLNAHDGSGSLKAIATTIRVVCSNTYNAADMDGTRRGTVATIRHTKNWETRIEDARQALTGARKESDELVEWFEFLAGVKVTASQVQEFVDRMFWPKDRGAVLSDTVRAHIETAIGRWYEAYRSPTCEGIQGTAYGIVQASGEYAQYLRPETRNDKNARRDAMTNRTVLSTSGGTRIFALRLGDVLGQKLAKANARDLRAEAELVDA